MKLYFATITILATGFLPLADARLGGDALGVASTVASEEADMVNALNRKKPRGWDTVLEVDFEMENFKDGDDGAPLNADDYVVAAYKEAFGEVFNDISMKWVAVDHEAALTNSDAEKLTHATSGYHLHGGYCQLCRRGVSGTDLTGATDSFIRDKRWKQVGPSMCEKLKMTGHKAFANVGGCIAQPSHASVSDVEEQLTELALKAAMEESTEGDMTFSGDLDRKKPRGWDTVLEVDFEMENFKDGDDGAPLNADDYVVAAYKEAFGEVFNDISMKWVAVDHEAALTKSDAEKLTHATSGYHLHGGYCQLCRRGVSGTDLTGATDSFIRDKRWRQVGPSMCEKLKMTGHKAFANVGGCIAQPSHASVSDVEEQLTELALKAAMEESTEGDMTFSGDLDRKKPRGWDTVLDIDFEMENFKDGDDGAPLNADDYVVAAYKEAFGEVFKDISMKWVAVDHEAALTNSDAEKLTHATSGYHLHGGYCQLCRRGVSGTDLTGTTDSFMRDKRWKQVGPSMCEKLKMTGHKAFANVGGCSASVTGGGSF